MPNVSKCAMFIYLSIVPSFYRYLHIILYIRNLISRICRTQGFGVLYEVYYTSYNTPKAWAVAAGCSRPHGPRSKGRSSADHPRPFQNSPPC